MNKKLVKRVAVASLAALMTIPGLAINNYAADALSMAQDRLKNYEQQLKNYESRGNTVMVEKTKERIAQAKNDIEKAKQNNEIKAQKAAQAQAVQAEKERIANTVYPLTARYVKDFVPAVDDYQPHFYERSDLPGVIFVLRQNSFGVIVDEKPNLKVEVLNEDYHIESNLYNHPDRIFDNVADLIKVQYISPFNCVPIFSWGDGIGGPSIEESGFAGIFCHHIGENRDFKVVRLKAKYYKSGWPDSYTGKHVNEITKDNCDLRYGWYGSPIFPTGPAKENILKNAKVTFTTDERITKSINVNKQLGAEWVNNQTIYSVAQEHGTDYTEEERKTLVIKPTPKSPYLNAKTEPIVDEKEWLEANGHMQMP